MSTHDNNSRIPLLPQPWRPPGITINAKQAAELIGCTQKAVTELCEDGTLKGFKYTPHKNAHWHILRDSVIAYTHKLAEQAGFDLTAPRPTRR